jgi:CRP-like cAMP-binding protein
MQRITLAELREKYNGVLPPGFGLRGEDDPLTDTIPPSSAPPDRGGGYRQKPKGGRRTRSERFAMLNAFADMGMADLTGAETKVWLILFRDTKADGLARTGQTDIARRSGLTIRGVQKALDKLQAKGLIRVVHRGRLNQGPSSYRVQAVGP